jgi:predicted 3-demethylubiquinone-9 3-methyltransferase (glyoxalase superfamily)
MSEAMIVPCLWFDDQAEAAADFYVSAFPDAQRGAVARYPTSLPNPANKEPGSVLTADFTVVGQRFTALNGGPQFAPNPSVSFFVRLAAEDEVDRLHDALIAGGQALMPLDAYPWSPRYAWVQDRFGVSWQLMAAPDLVHASVVPCLMFSGAQHGRAREAIDQYVGVFPRARIDHVATYGPGEGPEGTVAHGAFTLADQPMVAMDSHLAHGFGFDEGVSLQVMCGDQAEVDHVWSALADGGEEGPCGWLKDRFGVSWQVVPRTMDAWMTHPDEAARARAFEAMLGMSKLDVAALERALAGA